MRRPNVVMTLVLGSMGSVVAGRAHDYQDRALSLVAGILIGLSLVLLLGMVTFEKMDDE